MKRSPSLALRVSLTNDRHEKLASPTHIEFFDPKLTAPAEIHSIMGEVQAKTLGITFGATIPKLVAMMDRLTIVWAYGSEKSGHTYGEVVIGESC